jgi:hypothetical protein
MNCPYARLTQKVGQTPPGAPLDNLLAACIIQADDGVHRRAIKACAGQAA